MYDNVCNMIIGQIDDTEDNANSKVMGNGRYVHFILPLMKKAKSLQRYT